MEKKLLSSAIASAVALTVSPAADAANPNARQGLDNVLDEATCSYDEFDLVASWIDPNGDDYLEGDTKYGGDIELDATLYYECNFEGTEASEAEGFSGSETALIDVDLSQDESEPFHYFCEPIGEEAIQCTAELSWEDANAAADAAAEAKFGGMAAECTVQTEVCVEETQICTEYDYFCFEGQEPFQVGETWLCEGVSEECEEGEFCEEVGPVEPYPATQGECAEYESVCSEYETVTVEGNFSTYGEVSTDAVFSVKEMNPAKGPPGKDNRRQNYEKAYATCEASI